MFRHQILGLLRGGDPHHGYALVKEYVRRAGIETNTGYAYRDLQKLVDEGFVEVVANEQGADRRRRPYRITEAGRRSFDEWFSDIPNVRLGSDGELAARAIFFDEVDTRRVLDVLDRWRDDLRALHRQIEDQIDFPQFRFKGVLARASVVILRRRQRMAEVELAFLDDLRTSCTADVGGLVSTDRAPVGVHPTALDLRREA